MPFGPFGSKPSTKTLEKTVSEEISQEPFVCPTLEKAIERSTKEGRPAVLTVGGADGATITFLAAFGSKLTIEPFEPPRAPLPDQERKEFTLPYGSRTYDLILLWEWMDFFPKEYLADLGRELARISRPNATLLILSRSHQTKKMDALMQYKIHDERTISRVPLGRSLHPRYVHQTRSVEMALKRFSISGIHLQRDQTREILAIRNP